MTRMILDETTVKGGTVAVGDQVKVSPSQPGRHDGFVAIVRRISVNVVGDIEVDVYGGRPGHLAARCFRPDRLQRIARRRQAVTS